MRSNNNGQRRGRVALPDLELLAHFLNFDFRSDDVGELKAVFMSSLVFGKFPPRQKAKRIQAKLRRDLLPIIAPKEIPKPSEVYRLLERLVNKINTMGLKLEWAVEPVDYEFVDVSVDPERGEATGKTFELEKIAPDEARQKLRAYLAPGQRPLELSGSKWLVSERASLIDPGSLERYLYWTIIQALEHGTLPQLRRCKQCEKWFVQQDPRKEFCSPTCKDEFHNRARLASGYFNDYRKKANRQKINKARRLIKEGKSPDEVSKKTGLSLRILRRGGLVD